MALLLSGERGWAKLLIFANTSRFTWSVGIRVASSKEVPGKAHVTRGASCVGIISIIAGGLQSLICCLRCLWYINYTWKAYFHITVIRVNFREEDCFTCVNLYCWTLFSPFIKCFCGRRRVHSAWLDPVTFLSIDLTGFCAVSAFNLADVAL